MELGRDVVTDWWQRLHDHLPHHQSNRLSPSTIMITAGAVEGEKLVLLVHPVHALHLWWPPINHLSQLTFPSPVDVPSGLYSQLHNSSSQRDEHLKKRAGGCCCQCCSCWWRILCDPTHSGSLQGYVHINTKCISYERCACLLLLVLGWMHRIHTRSRSTRKTGSWSIKKVLLFLPEREKRNSRACNEVWTKHTHTTNQWEIRWWWSRSSSSRWMDSMDGTQPVTTTALSSSLALLPSTF